MFYARCSFVLLSHFDATVWLCVSEVLLKSYILMPFVCNQLGETKKKKIKISKNKPNTENVYR